MQLPLREEAFSVFILQSLIIDTPRNAAYIQCHRCPPPPGVKWKLLLSPCLQLGPVLVRKRVLSVGQKSQGWLDKQVCAVPEAQQVNFVFIYLPHKLLHGIILSV